VTDRSTDNLLRLAEVRARAKLSRTTIYRKMADGTFPRNVPISAGLSAWYESDINAWVADPMGWRAEAA
jgi:prophage regulatory protein